MGFNNLLPGVYGQITDGNLQLISGNPEETVLNLGVATGGTVNVAAAYGSANALSALGLGAGADYCSYQLNVAGGPVLFMPVNRSVSSSAGNGAYVGTHAGTVAVAAGPCKSFAITVIVGGASGSFTVTLDGVTGPAVTFPGSPFSYAVPGTYTTITFSDNGTSFVAGDIYTFTTAGAVSHSGSGAGTITQASEYVDNYMPVITVDAYGTTSTSPYPQLTYSLDNGETSVGTITLSSSGKLALDGTGIVLTFSGAFYSGDGYSFLTCGPSFGTTDITNALNAVPNTLSYSMVHIVRGAELQDSAHAEAEAAALQTLLDGKFAVGTSARGFIAVPTLGSVSTVGSTLTVDTVDTDGYLAAQFQNLSAVRIDACAGDVQLTSPKTGLSLRRPCSWVVAARDASISASTMAADVGLGGVDGVIKLYRDEFQTPALDAARFTTMRTFAQDPGFYITLDRLMAPVGSDYAFMVYGRVVDLMWYYSNQWATPLVNSKIPTNQNPNAVKGSIDPGFAASLNASGSAFLKTALVPKELVSVALQIDQSVSLANRVLPVLVSGVVYVYGSYIDVSLALAFQL